MDAELLQQEFISSGTMPSVASLSSLDVGPFENAQKIFGSLRLDKYSTTGSLQGGFQVSLFYIRHADDKGDHWSFCGDSL